MKQQALFIFTALLLLSVLLSSCAPAVAPTPPATAVNSQAAAEPIYTVTPQTNTPASPTTATAAPSLTAVPPITNSVTSPPTNTATPKATITPAIVSLPLTSDTLTPVSAEQTPWLDWAEQYLSVDTVCAPHSADLSLAAFRWDGFHVYDPRTNELKWTYEMPVEPVGGGPIVFSPDNQYVAHGGSDKMLYIWDARTGQLLREVTYDHEIYDIKFSGDGNWIIVLAGEDGIVLEAVNVFSGLRRSFPIFAARSDTAILIDDPHVIVFLYYRVEKGEERILKWNPEDDSIETFIPLGSEQWVQFEFDDGSKAYSPGLINVSPGGDLVSVIIYGGSEISFYLWDILEKQWVPLQDSILPNQESIRYVIFSPSSSFLALYSFLNGDQARVWNRAGELLGEVNNEGRNLVEIQQCPHQSETFGKASASTLSSIAFTPDDAYLATFGYLSDGTKDVLLWPLPR